MSYPNTQNYHLNSNRNNVDCPHRYMKGKPFWFLTLFLGKELIDTYKDKNAYILTFYATIYS